MNNLGVEYVENAAPTANAGNDQTVASGKAFTLDAGGSTDPDGPGLNFQWTQIAGSPTVIQDPKKSKTTVTGIAGPKTLTYRVTATDQFGRSDADQVTINAVSKPTSK